MAEAGRHHSGRDRGVDETGAVEVDSEVVFTARGDNRVQLVQGPHPSARAVVRVLDRDDARRGDMDTRPVADLSHDLARGETALRSLEPDGQQAGMRRGDRKSTRLNSSHSQI